MHTGQPNPQSITNEKISGKRVSNNSIIIKYVFSRIKCFWEVWYNWLLCTYEYKNWYTINHYVFRLKTVQELNTLNSLYEIE